MYKFVLYIFSKLIGFIFDLSLVGLSVLRGLVIIKIRKFIYSLYFIYLFKDFFVWGLNLFIFN